MSNKLEKTFVVGICGASGAIYGIRLLKYLLANPFRIYLIISDKGYSVLKHETGCTGSNMEEMTRSQGIIPHQHSELILCKNNDFFVSPASGSFRHDGMVVAPCSMRTLGAITRGISDNLLCRSADVTLKEKRPLILLPRESPFNLIHIKNMELAHLAGATIMPPILPFYGEKSSITTMVDSFIGRVLDHLHVGHSLYKEWGQPQW